MGWGGGGGRWVKPPSRHVWPSYRPDKHPQRPLEGVTDVSNQLQKTTAFLVLPIGLKAHVMNIRGLTGPGSSRVKKQTWLHRLVLSMYSESVWT